MSVRTDTADQHLALGQQIVDRWKAGARGPEIRTAAQRQAIAISGFLDAHGDELDQEDRGRVDRLGRMVDDLDAIQSGGSPRMGGITQSAFEWARRNVPLFRDVSSQTQKVGEELDVFFTGTRGGRPDPNAQSGLRKMLEKYGKYLLLGAAALLAFKVFVGRRG